MWINQQAGYLQDYITQLWVKVTGKKIDPAQYPWLVRPMGGTRVVDNLFIQQLLADENLTLHINEPHSGLMAGASAFGLSKDEEARVHPAIFQFYTHTCDYEMEIWSRWAPGFSLFGRILRLLFSQRLQQLNIPLDPLETSKGFESHIYRLKDTEGHPRYTLWYRKVKSTGQVAYSGIYDTTLIPGHPARCVRVSFPLPNGSATVLLRLHLPGDGSLKLISDGRQLGQPGFYFYLTGAGGKAWVKPVKAVKEEIHLYVDDQQILRTDHVLKFYNREVFRLHYKITPAKKLL